MSESNTESSTALSFRGPFLIQWIGAPPLKCRCLQAAYDGPDAPVTLAEIDPSGQTPLQQWYYGSDQRIYLKNSGGPCIDFANPPQNGTPLQLATVNAGDRTQMWQWSGTSNVPTFSNVGAGASPTYVIDNGGGGVNPGNKVQIWNSVPNANQFWALTSIPAFAPQQ